MCKKDCPWSQPEGITKKIDYPKVPAYASLLSAAALFPRRKAIIFDSCNINYKDLLDYAKRFAGGIKGFVKKGDRVAIHLPNCPQFTIVYFGALLAGATIVPCNQMLSARELNHQLKDSGAVLIITLDTLLPDLEKARDGTAIEKIVVTSLEDTFPVFLNRKGRTHNYVNLSSLLEAALPPPEVDIDPENDLAHIAYTGGTTGIPKGAMITHYNAIVNAIQWCSYVVGKPVYKNNLFFFEDPQGEFPCRFGKEKQLAITPWTHAMGLIGNLQGPFLSGMTVAPLIRFDPEIYLESIEQWSLTLAGGSPTLTALLLAYPNSPQYDLSSIKSWSSGAAPCPQELIGRIQSRINGFVREGYGLTEATMGVSQNPGNFSGIRKAGSAGLPFPDTEIRIVNDLGEDLPCGEEGEVLVKGPQVMRGYWNKPEDTSLVLKEGWLSTGDIGKLDADGYLYIIDRKKI